MNYEFPSGYVVLPPDIRFNSDLDFGQKLLMGELIFRATLKGKCVASNDYLAFIMGVGERTISRWLEDMEKKGFLTRFMVKNKKGTKNMERYITLHLTEKDIIHLSIRDTEVLAILRSNMRGTKPLEPMTTLKRNLKLVLPLEKHKEITELVSLWSQPIITKGKTIKTGVQHKINPNPEAEQSQTILRISDLYYLAKNNKELFFASLIDKCYPSWVQKNGITKESFLKSSVDVSKALSIHYDLLTKGIVAENNYKLTRNLEAFLFLNTASNKTDPEGISWFLYWVCKEVNQKEKEFKKETLLVEPKYQGEENKKWNQLYREIPKRVFHINKNKTPISFQNEVTKHIDSIVDRLYPYYITEDKVNLKSLNMVQFTEFYITFHTGESWKELPNNIEVSGIKACSVNSKTWDLFLDFLCKKQQGVPDKWKKHCGLIYNNERHS